MQASIIVVFFYTLYSLENFELRDFTKRNLISFKDLILNTQQQINTSISVQELKNIINSFIDNISYRQWLIDSSSSEKQAEFRYANIIEVTKWIVNQLEDESYNGLESLATVLNKMLLIDILDRDNEDKNRQSSSDYNYACLERSRI